MKASQLASLLDVSTKTIYNRFNDEGDGPFEYKGVVIYREDIEGTHGYDYLIEEDVDDPKRTFDSVLENAAKHQKKMIEVAQHMSDLDVMIDDDMFQMVLDERKEAASGLRDAIQVLGRMCVEHPDRVRFMGIPPEIEDEEIDEEALPSFDAVLIYGGDANQHAVRRLKDALGAGEIVWQDDKNKHRKIDSLTQQVENGQFDLVIAVLYGVSHNGANGFSDACKQSDTPFVAVQNGQGVSRILRAVKHYTGQELSPHGA